MSRMSELDIEMRRFENQRFRALDMAVRNYLSHLYAFEQGAGDGRDMDYWREQLEILTSGEPVEVD